MLNFSGTKQRKRGDFSRRNVVQKLWELHQQKFVCVRIIGFEVGATFQKNSGRCHDICKKQENKNIRTVQHSKWTVSSDSSTT